MSTLSIRLEQRTGALVVGVALAAVALLFMLPSVAETQQTSSVEGAQGGRRSPHLSPRRTWWLSPATLCGL